MYNTTQTDATVHPLQDSLYSLKTSAVITVTESSCCFSLRCLSFCLCHSPKDFHANWCNRIARIDQLQTGIFGNSYTTFESTSRDWSIFTVRLMLRLQFVRGSAKIGSTRENVNNTLAVENIDQTINYSYTTRRIISYGQVAYR